MDWSGKFFQTHSNKHLTYGKTIWQLKLWQPETSGCVLIAPKSMLQLTFKGSKIALLDLINKNKKNYFCLFLDSSTQRGGKKKKDLNIQLVRTQLPKKATFKFRGHQKENLSIYNLDKPPPLLRGKPWQSL